MSRTRWGGLVATLVLATGLAGTPTTARGADLPTPDEPGGLVAPHSPDGFPANGQGPVYRLWTTASMAAGSRPGMVPQGANDFSCRPRAGENPVVLVPGTGEDAFANWSWMSAMLSRDGWCVYTFNHNPSTGPAGRLQESSAFSGDIRSSAAMLARVVETVRERTGAEKVDLVGHSQGGGPMPRAYLKWYGGADKVGHLVGITPSNHGTTVGGLAQLLRDTNAATNGYLLDYARRHNMLATPQQLAGSSFLTELNAGGLTQPGVRYTVIATRHDATITPYTNSFIDEPGVVNQTLQDVCPADLTGHPGASYNTAVYQLVRNALAPARAMPVNCTQVPPLG